VTPATLSLGGKKFVVIPQAEYRQLKAKAAGAKKTNRAKRRPSRQERGDVAESLRRLADDERIPLDVVVRRLGLEPDSLRK
jgi:hypothetical protein